MSWVIRLDGAPFTAPHELEKPLKAASEASRAVLGDDVHLFARVDDVGGSSVAYAAAADAPVLVGAEGEGAGPEEALGFALNALVASLSGSKDLIPQLGERPPVADVLIDVWYVPARARGFTDRLEAVLDQRFVYQLSDAEALARAQLEGRSFYLYGAHGRRELRLLLRAGATWLRAMDIERPVWRLGSGAVTEVEVLIEDARTHAAGPGVLKFGPRNIITADTLDAALDSFALLGHRVALANVRAMKRPLAIIRYAPGVTCILGYETDTYRTRADTGPFGVPAWAASTPPGPAKRVRLDRVLVCPDCRADLCVDATESDQACSRCHRRFRAASGVVDFLLDGACAVVNDPDASRNTPGKQLLHDMRLDPAGLVLNAGAGDTPLCADNLINLEIVRYQNTDVVVDGLHMPFRDGSFDVVFSQSVIEHVKDPFAYARELIRVLKPGGTLIADAPFVGPFHGYPDHYFNPTMNGLRVLCGGLEEIEVREGSHHDPAVAIFSLLSAFVRLVRDDEARERLLRLPIGEFLSHIQTGQNPAVTRDLDPSGTFEISSGFVFYGRKKVSPRRIGS